MVTCRSYQSQLNAAKAMLRGRLMALNTMKFKNQ